MNMLKTLMSEIRKYKGKRKDPLSLIMELGQISGKTPTFVVTPKSGLVYGPNKFTCKGSFLYVETEGEGNSKQDAKRSATVQILKSIMHDMDEDIMEYVDSIFSVTDVRELPVSQPSISPQPSSGENYVGHLQEYTQRLGLPMPAYKELKEEGPAHDKKFSFEVMLPSNGWKAVGVGAKKNAAKRQAACNLLDRINKSPSLFSKQSEDYLEKSLHKVSSAPPQVSLDHSYPTSSVSTSEMGNSTSAKLPEPEHFSHGLSNTDTERRLRFGSQIITVDNCIDTLHWWAESQDVTVSYQPVKSKNPFLKLSIVKVLLDPPVVCSGQGISMEDSYADGAINVLEQLHYLGLFHS